jgi:hypothetical protein
MRNETQIAGAVVSLTLLFGILIGCRAMNSSTEIDHDPAHVGKTALPSENENSHSQNAVYSKSECHGGHDHQDTRARHDSELVGDEGVEYLEGAQVQSLSQLVNDSSRVAVGRFIGKRCARGQGEDRVYIFTYYRFKVTDILKGFESDELELRVAGGRLESEDITMEASHQPHFELGEQGVIFIDKDPLLFTSVTAGKQGFLKFDTGMKRSVWDGFGRTVTGLGVNSKFLSNQRSEAMDRTMLLQGLRDLVEESEKAS